MELADRVKLVKPSVTLSITAKAKKMKAEGRDVVGFGAGEPDFDTPENIKQAGIQAIKNGFTKYTPESGVPELKQAIAAKLNRDNGLDYPPAAISVGCGAKHSLYNIFQAICQAGDEIIIPSPYWLSYPEMVRLAGGTPVFMKTSEKTGFKISPQDLKKAITKKTKALIVNSPSNPTGTIYDRSELQEIADIAVSKNILVVSDEIYEKLLYDGSQHISIASLGPDIKKFALIVNGVSKTYSMTGWRIGYVAADEKIIQGINTIQSHSTSNPTSISQRAAIEAISGDQTSVEKMRKEFESRRNYMLDRLKNIRIFGAFKPKGAFYVFCDISKTGLSSMELTNKLLDEEMVAVVPGEPFGSDRHIRLSFAVGMQEITKGMDRLEKWASQRR